MLYITGICVPDCTGTYRIQGCYDGRSEYDRDPDPWFVWCDTLLGLWYISQVLDDLSGPYWQLHNEYPVGAFFPMNGASGTVISRRTIPP